MTDENLNATGQQKSQKTNITTIGVLLALVLSLGGLVYYNKVRRQEAPAAVQAAASGQQEPGLDKQEPGAETQAADAAAPDLPDAQKPELPLQVIRRRSSAAGAFAVEFHNTTAEPLAVRVLFERRSTKASRRFDMLIGANAVEPVGDFQEWAFVAGDSISIRKAGFKPIEVTVGD